MGTVTTRIDEIMEEKGMTESQLAAATGLNPRTIHDLVRGNYERIGLSTIALLCDTLNVKPGDLFKYTKGK